MNPNRYVSTRPLSLRKAILQHAGECVDRFGLQRTTVQKVAEMVGVSRQTIHSYFPTKEMLIGELIYNHMLDGVEQTLNKIDLTKPASTVVEDTMMHMIKYMQQPRGLVLMDPANRDIAVKASETKNIVKVYVSKLWIPILTQLKADGHIRMDIDLTDTGKWLFLIQFSAMQVKQISSRELHRLIQTFLVPSVVRD